MPTSEAEISHGVTAFIDVLGFSAQVKQAKTKAELQSIIKKINTIQSEFEHDPQKQNVIDNQKISGRKVIAFSDSIIIHISDNSETISHSGFFDTLMMEFVSLGFQQALCVFQNIFIRGALDVGWFHYDSSVLISDALVNAAALEKRAEVPVIAICKKLYGKLSTDPIRKTYAPEIEPLKNMFRQYTPENKDTCPFFYLDYMNICLNNIDDGHYKWLLDHAKIITYQLNSHIDKKILKKYEWLAMYHNEVAKEWTKDEQCLIKPTLVT
ncbi:MAG: hypothetical protein ACXW1C_01470 [Gallionella sp.]